MRGSARTAVSVLGLMLLWVIAFSAAGSMDLTTSSLIVWAAAAAAGTFALHRFLLRCEDRGWIYYRKGRGGDGRLTMTAEWLNMYDPSRRHLQEAVREGEWKRDEDDEGAGK